MMNKLKYFLPNKARCGIMFLLSWLFLSVSSATGRDIKVIDENDHIPLPGTTVIGNSGLILGVTDESGNIPEPSANQYPLSIRSIGYESSFVPSFTDTVRLTPALYTLNEVVVNSNERPIKRIVCFAREYASGATGPDTLQLYSEYMLEAFLKDSDRKVKGYKSGDADLKSRNVKRYCRVSDASGLDSVARPNRNDDIIMLSWENILQLPSDKFQESSAIANGALADTIMGKYGPNTIYRKMNNLYTVTVDHLSEYEDHKWSPAIFKLLGLSMDLRKSTKSDAFNVTETGSYSIEDYIYSTFTINLLAKGKFFKKTFKTDKPVEMDTYIELYPVSIEYLTPEEYKESRKEKQEIPFRAPLNLQPLPEAIQKIVERVENL